MKAAAAKAGFLDSPFGGHDNPDRPRCHPRMQIMTIESLLQGATADLSPLAIEANFRRAEKEDRTKRDQGNLLALSGIEAPAVMPVVRGTRWRRTPQPRS